MTKREAWEKIARAFAQSESTGRRNRLTRSGLCAAADEVASRDFDLWVELAEDLNTVRNEYNDTPNGRTYLTGWWWPLLGDKAFSPACDGERAMLAGLLAELAE